MNLSSRPADASPCVITMLKGFTSQAAATGHRARALEKRWQKLCVMYLPVADAGSIWNYHCSSDSGPAFGWKLHVSATILNAPKILERISPELVKSGVQFKAARSLDEIAKLNSGLHQTYTQVGKVITVYPHSDEEAVRLATRLHELTRHFKAPAVPFDLQFADGSNVYYRYGAFKRVELKEADDVLVLGVRSHDGDLIPDDRKNPKPDWITDPFAAARPKTRQRRPLQHHPKAFHVLRAIVQRGKGGVYQAVDTHSNPPRLCLLKEGRKRGEVSWDGRDGAWRAHHEERVLDVLRRRGVPVPEVYSSFELDGNYYLVIEFVDGDSLHDILLRQSRRLAIPNIVYLGSQLSEFLARMHRAGWAWRDCKPKNLIITREGNLVPIDFEGASEIENPDCSRWGTRGFIPPKSPKDLRQAVINDDLFGLGATLYLLITGRMFDRNQPAPIGKLRKHVPLELRQLVESLLDDTTQTRPTIASVYAQLNSILRRQSKCSLRLTDTQAA